MGYISNITHDEIKVEKEGCYIGKMKNHEST